MALKWVGALLAIATLTAFATANGVSAALDAVVPLPVNLLLVAVAAGAAVLVVFADLHRRLDERLEVLSDFAVARSDEILARLDALETHAVGSAFDAVTPIERYAPKRR